MIGTDIFVGENKGDSSSQSKRDALKQELVIIMSPRIVRKFKGGQVPRNKTFETCHHIGLSTCKT